MSRDRLGKGLGALLGEYLEPEIGEGDVRKLPLTSIVPNPVQPRRVFTDAELENLTSSIRERLRKMHNRMVSSNVIGGSRARGWHDFGDPNSVLRNENGCKVKKLRVALINE